MAVEVAMQLSRLSLPPVEEADFEKKLAIEAAVLHESDANRFGLRRSFMPIGEEACDLPYRWQAQEARA